MNKERKDISELLKEYYNRPLELIEENKKLKKKIDKLQKENKQLKAFYENDYIRKSKIRDKIKEIEENEDCTYCNNTCSKYYVCNVLKELLGE